MADSFLVDHIAEVERTSRDVLSMGQHGGYGPEDMRAGFFNNVSNALMNYATTLGLVHTAGFMIGVEAVQRDGALVPLTDPIVTSVGAVLLSNYRVREGAPRFFDFYIAKLKSRLFHETWEAFEDAARLFYDHAVPQSLRDEDEQLERAKYARPRNRVHIEMPRIWGRLSEVTKANGAGKQERDLHRAVVEFYGAARNAVHTNTIYDGPARKLKVGGEEIRLRSGDPVDFLHIDKILLLVMKLVCAFAFVKEYAPCQGEITSRVSKLRW